ncbi:hypothetical protein WJX73_000367 [Symbiochloris irregularis]|uniref:Zinc-finger domain-containing protein n=1 Tax=Symbiochloris irregularis TaxID=706552 RepID=A0AAW1NRX8_9CHLO
MAAMNAYELAREARIADNKRRMEELGLLKLAQDFRATCATAKARPDRKPREPRQARVPSDLRLPARRSGRNAGVAAPNYNENALDCVRETTTRATLADRHVVSQKEEYTPEDIAKLGAYEKEWALFVDGYDADGNRVYDKVAGETCHQCRQKTLGRHTACSQCHSLRGVFCGDCLFMRYGENIEEAMAEESKDSWVCPVCRDLCNCSFHRIRKGWAPTGTMYRQALKQGFKSVAHYLVLTKQASSEPSMPVPVTASVQEAAAAPLETVPAAVVDEGCEPVKAASPEPVVATPVRHSDSLHVL